MGKSLRSPKEINASDCVVNWVVYKAQPLYKILCACLLAGFFACDSGNPGGSSTGTVNLGGSSPISEELLTAMEFAFPLILKNDLIDDQPMIYIFSSHEPLPIGTAVGPYQSADNNQRQILNEPMWLMQLEPSPFEDMGHPVTYYLIDLDLDDVAIVSSNSPPAVDGVLFPQMPQQPLLSVLSPMLGAFEVVQPPSEMKVPTIRTMTGPNEDDIEENGRTYEIVFYFEGNNGSYGHVAIGWNIQENGKIVEQRIYDNTPKNPAHGSHNKSIGQYMSIYEFALQVYKEGEGVSYVTIPATASQQAQLETYCKNYFKADPWCKVHGCFTNQLYDFLGFNCVDFVQGGAEVALEGIVHFPAILSQTPNDIFTCVSRKGQCMTFSHDMLMRWFDTGCICYSKVFIKELGKWKYAPHFQGPCMHHSGSTPSYCGEFDCKYGMCQSNMQGEYQDCLSNCNTPYKLGCAKPCEYYCEAFKNYIFAAGCGEIVAGKAPAGFDYVCRDLPKMGLTHAIACSK